MSFPAYTPKARVQKPAPAFSGTAVVDGTFEGKPSPSHGFKLSTPTIS